jgi:hypothetical protein
MAQGTDVIIGHQRGTTWNTPVSVNVANAGLALTGWPLGTGLGDLLYDRSLTGSGFKANAIRGLAKLNGDGPGLLRYTGLEHIVAMAMGIAGVPSTVDTDARLHTFQLATNLDGLFDTIAVFKGPSIPVWEYASVKYTGLIFTFTSDGLAELTIPMIASSVKPLTGQTNTTLASVTYRSKVLNVFGSHLSFWANTASGAALDNTFRFYPSRLVFTYRRAMDSDFVMDGSGVQPEPYYTDQETITLDLDFPVYGVVSALHANNTFLTNALAETPMKIQINAISPVLAGAATEPYSIKIQAPNCIIGPVDMPVTQPGAIPQNVPMAAIEAAVAPTGMTGLTKPFRILWTSKMTTDALLNP